MPGEHAAATVIARAGLLVLLWIWGAAPGWAADSLEFESDKQKHFLVSVALGAASAAAARERGEAPCDAAAIGVTFTVVIGAGKEYYDRRYKSTHHWSWQDLFWDFTGAAVGSMLASGCR